LKRDNDDKVNLLTKFHLKEMDALTKEIYIIKKGVQVTEKKLSQVTKNSDDLLVKEDHLSQCDKCDDNAKLETEKQEHMNWNAQGNSKVGQTEQPENEPKAVEPKEVSSSESKQELKCAKCQYVAKSKGMLTMHIEVQHTGFIPCTTFQCETCNLKTKTVGQLMTHVKINHSTEYQQLINKAKL
jgi:hypothetical protein